MPQRVGRYTLRLDSAPAVTGQAAVVGKKEGEGPLGAHFDKIHTDLKLGLPTWEKAESALLQQAVQTAMDKAGVTRGELDCAFAGDLLNQCVSSTYGLRDLAAPFVGVFGACSTMSLALALAGLFVDGGLADTCAAATSSHFCTAERQFRTPLEYGSLRTPTAQWTVTGSGAAVVSRQGEGPRLRQVTLGRIVDKGVTDMTNMGAAMAPAAADTIFRFLQDTGTAPEDYDLILTGDLGRVGSRLLCELLTRQGVELASRHTDCGLLIYDPHDETVGAGGSGCGCAAAVLCGYLLPRMRQGALNSLLFCATGALMSPTTNQQGESIPAIAHLVHITAD